MLTDIWSLTRDEVLDAAQGTRGRTKRFNTQGIQIDCMIAKLLLAPAKIFPWFVSLRPFIVFQYPVHISAMFVMPVFCNRNRLVQVLFNDLQVQCWYCTGDM